MNDQFFNYQRVGTAAKIKFYKEYIGGYLIKILMSFGQCFVADLFCGPGKNGNESGSPLVLVEQAKKMLNIPLLKGKFSEPKISVLFNDENRQHIENLKKEIDQMGKLSNLKIYIENESFSDILNHDVFKKIENMAIPKFIFLDQYNYSTVKLMDIKQLYKMKNSEILLFLPTSHAHRFIKIRNKNPKLNNFLKDFTEVDKLHDGISIYEFNQLIRDKLREELKTDLVGFYLIDNGKTKTTLFLITKSLKGMYYANCVFLKNSDNGMRIKADEIGCKGGQGRLIDVTKLSKSEFFEPFYIFSYKLEEMFKKKKRMTNVEIFRFAIISQVSPNCAARVLKELKKDKKIDIKYTTKRQKGFYISENNGNDVLCNILYK